jgi:hypothetical protein
MAARTLFLLSPAHCGGKRAGYLMNERATFPLARRIQAGGIAATTSIPTTPTVT